MTHQGGFTLIELMVVMAIFAIIAVGAVGMLGAADAGGLLGGVPTGGGTTRLAKDMTAATVYLQAFHEFTASRGSANATPGTYCIGTACSPEVFLPAGLSGYPTPPGSTYQLEWTRLLVLVETWYWDTSTNRFTPTPTANETITRVQSTLTWQMRGISRSLTMDRFIP